MAATMSDLQREREILDNELTESRFMFAESLKSGLGDEIKATLKEQKKAAKAKKAEKPSRFKMFLNRLADICQ